MVGRIRREVRWLEKEVRGVRVIFALVSVVAILPRSPIPVRMQLTAHGIAALEKEDLEENPQPERRRVRRPVNPVTHIR
jgi:hypothetical protein